MSRSEIIKEDVQQVKQLLKKVIENEDFLEIERLGGLTNHTYHVKFANGNEYAVRLPGEGTEDMIIRTDEKKSTFLACKLNIDAQCLYFGEDGSKVTVYIKDAETMNKEKLHMPEHIKQMADIFNILHKSGEDTGVPFEVFDVAATYKENIRNSTVMLFDDFNDVEILVADIKAEIDSLFERKLVPCHNDALCENWVIGNGRMYLIDWEYAGMNDGMWDLADVSLEAEFDEEHDMMFLKEYLHKEPTEEDKKHFLASKIYVDYLWTLWALNRAAYPENEDDYIAMMDWAKERYERLKVNIVNYSKI